VRSGARGVDLSELPLVVFSHLRWDSVYQRPQHLISRLARRQMVLFVEEPVAAEPGVPDSWDVQFATPRLRICRPILTNPGAGFGGELDRLAKMMNLLLRWQEVGEHAAWLYTPMAWPLARSLSPELVVYDCMDELSAFLGAPPDMRAREAELIRAADVVFTGGASLYRAKRALHPRVRCFPSSVDARHFRPAREALALPPDLRAIEGPRLGFYGVLDERLDLDLLAALADARPDWQTVLVGPICKIDPASLPQRKNLHYLGQRSYADLPGYLAGFDVCLLPFARNEATRFISPTKTLEYMAAEKPIVSTRIPDVADAYADVVYLADTADDFVAGCSAALTQGAAEREKRAEAMQRILQRTSWATTVEAMRRELRLAARRRPLLLPARATTAASAAGWVGSSVS
jgi:UDP-galactopyranose mutase